MTDRAGGFALAAPAGHRLRISAGAAGYLRGRSVEYRLTGDRRPGPTFAMTRAVHVEGTVVDDLGSRPYRLKRAKVKDRFKKVLGELLKVEEERSRGRETRHGKEQVSTLVIGDSVFAQQITDREPDTTTIRRREP